MYVLAGGLALAGFVLGFTNWALDVPPKFFWTNLGCCRDAKFCVSTLRQPRGQRPRLRRHLLPAAVLRGGGGVRGGENVMEPLQTWNP